MEVDLFKPLDLKKWLKLGSLTFLNQIPLFLFLFFLNFLIIPTKFLQWSKIFPVLPHIFLIFPFLFLFFLLIFFFFLYISSYSNYFYLALLIEKKIDSFENYYKDLAKNYFILNIFIYIILAFSLIFGFYLIFFFKDLLTNFFIFIFLILYLTFFSLLNIFLKDLYLPLSYFKKLSILENLHFLLQKISAKPFKFIFFVLIKSLLIIILYSGILFMGIMSFGILLLFFIIPIIGQTIFQPVIYFLNLFGLNFFENFVKLDEKLIKNG